MRLEAEKIRLQYGGKVVAEELDFCMEKPEIISIIGPNGSGKSTVLKALGRLLKPTSGTVYLDGKNIHKMEPKAVARKISILPQTAMAPGDMTIYDLVCYGRMPHRGMLASQSDTDEEIIREAMESAGVYEMRHRNLAGLSGGERQRAWIAMALAQSPEILLLDEPTTYLDIYHQLELMQLIRRLHEEKNIAVIMVLHDLNHAARFSERLVAVKKGHILADGPADEVFTEEMLGKLYGVEVTVMHLPIDGRDVPVCIPYETMNKHLA